MHTSGHVDNVFWPWTLFYETRETQLIFQKQRRSKEAAVTKEDGSQKYAKMQVVIHWRVKTAAKRWKEISVFTE
jgi:hypothetical protein